MFRKIVLFLLCLVLLVACGTETTESSDENTQDTAVNEPAVEEAEMEEVAANPLDTATLDVCTLIPQDDVAALIGALREVPEASTPMGDERGCTYLTEEGFVYTIEIMPLDRWENITLIFSDLTPISNLGDEAYSREASNDLFLYALVKGRAAVHIYDTNENMEASTQLAELAISIIQQN